MRLRESCPCALAVWTFGLAFAQRFDLSLKSRSHGKAEVDNVFSVTRQRQFPFARPGTFIRLPAPRSKTSCNGAIVKAATEDHAISISAVGAGSRASVSGDRAIVRTIPE